MLEQRVIDPFFHFQPTQIETHLGILSQCEREKTHLDIPNQLEQTHFNISSQRRKRDSQRDRDPSQPASERDLAIVVAG